MLSSTPKLDCSFFPPPSGWAATVAHQARLCPGLREFSGRQKDCAALAAALEGLAPAAGTLETLCLGDRILIEPAAVPRAAEALRTLSGLRRLEVNWDGPDAVALLARALPALTSLSRWGRFVLNGGHTGSSSRWTRGQGH